MARNELKNLGLAETPRPTRASQDELPQREPDLLRLLEGVFLAPMLSLAQVYLYYSNGSKKTIENCILEFRTSHPWAWKTFFVLDFFFRSIYMIIVLIVVIRGLAIGDYIMGILG